MDERVVLNVRIFARNLKSTHMFHSVEIEDIEQELMYEVLLCLHKFDETQGELEHFIRKILARRSVNLLQSFTCVKRGTFVNFREYTESKISNSHNDNFDENTIDDYLIDMNRLMDYLPGKLKALCILLKSYSVAETSRITGKSRASLYRALKRISLLANCRSSSEDQFLVVLKNGVNMKNLSIIETLSTKEISALEVYDLMDLSEQVAKLTNHAKELKEKLDDGLNLKFSEAVKNSLRSENKNTGTTKFFDGAFQITAEVPKKVTWDQEKMEELIKRVPDERRKAIVKITYAIEERKYAELPHEYQELFREARTITPGKTKFQISIGETK
jgi:DNA-directed RNA polymerase specialized sigma24 family protein